MTESSQVRGRDGNDLALEATRGRMESWFAELENGSFDSRPTLDKVS
jgi:hypothetical protein